MPYVNQESRFRLRQVQEVVPESAADLNYCFTKLIKNYLSGTMQNYQHYNDVMGALEGCKLEIYRRQIAEYENLKREENGDV